MGRKETMRSRRKLNLARIKARERFKASLHEAAHEVIARHHGIHGYAQVVERDARDGHSDRTFIGNFTYDIGPTLTPSIKRLISVAGAVGVALFDREVLGMDFDERLPFIHEGMSPSDCRGAGFPEFDDDIFFAEQSAEFADAVEQVETLLCGDLRAKWLELASDLRGPVEMMGMMEE
jgi:hypothetical protein